MPCQVDPISPNIESTTAGTQAHRPVGGLTDWTGDQYRVGESFPDGFERPRACHLRTAPSLTPSEKNTMVNERARLALAERPAVCRCQPVFGGLRRVLAFAED